MVGHFALEGRGRWHNLSLLRSVGEALALSPQRRSCSHRLQHLLAQVRMCDNFDGHEILVTAHVIGMVVRVDQAAKGLIGAFPDGGDEGLRVYRPRRGIDHEYTVVADDDAGVGNAPVGNARSAPLDVGVNVGRELPKLGLPTRNLRKARVGRRWYYRRRWCWRRRVLRPKERRITVICQS